MDSQNSGKRRRTSSAVRGCSAALGALLAWFLAPAIEPAAFAAEAARAEAGAGLLAAPAAAEVVEKTAAAKPDNPEGPAPSELCGEEPESPDQKQIEELMRRMEEERRKDLAALKEDPAWKPSHEKVRVIRPCDPKVGEVLETFSIDGQGRILAGCFQPADQPEELHATDLPQRAFKAAWLRIISPDGKQLASWKLDVMPSAVCVAPDGTIFVGGDGRIAKLSPEGKVLAVADTPGLVALREAEEAKQKAEQEKAEKAKAEKKEGREDAAADAQEKKSGKIGKALLRAFGLGGSGEPSSAESEAEMAAWQKHRAREVTGLTANDADVFVCGGMPEGFGYSVWRLDHDLQNPQLIVKDLRGCCGQMDIQAEGDRLWIPVNGEHKVKCYDRDGKELLKFGKRDRKKAEGFGGCCEPKNVRIAGDGSIYTAESGPPVVVKRFDPAGKLLGVVALPEYASGCVRVTVAASPDESEVYLLNTGEQSIYVFADKRSTPTHEQTATIDFGNGEQPTQLNTFCIGGDGRLYAACGRFAPAMASEGTNGSGAPSRGTAAEIRVFDADGKLQKIWSLDFTPQALAAISGGVIVAGEGRLVHYDFEGKPMRSADSPHVRELPALPEIPPPEKPLSAEEQKARAERLSAAKEARDAAQKALVEKMAQLRAAAGDAAKREALQKEYAELLREFTERSAAMNEAAQTPRAKALQARAAQMRQRSISAVAVGDKDLFIACPMAKGFGFAIWRTDHSFGEGRLIAEGLRGCCGQMDIQARGDQVFVAENARKRVVVYDRDGKQAAAWGESQRGGLEGFGSCCNPMNLRFNAAGELITSEASLGRLKRYSPAGQLLGLVGMATVEGGCKNVAVDLSPDGTRCYVMDLGKNRICVLSAKSAKSAE